MMNTLKSCPVELVEKLVLSYPEAIDTLNDISTLKDKRELLEHRFSNQKPGLICC